MPRMKILNNVAREAIEFLPQQRVALPGYTTLADLIGAEIKLNRISRIVREEEQMLSDSIRKHFK